MGASFIFVSVLTGRLFRSVCDRDIQQTRDFVGVLNDIMWLPNNDIYVIKNGSQEFLIPVIPEVIKRLDHDKKIILITPMDGLLD